MIKYLRYVFLMASVFLLSGCKMAILDPKGIIAASEKQILIDSTLLMLIVVIPVIILSFVFAWHYRAKNKKAKYSPDWADSHLLESIWWGVPCIIILILAIMTWVGTHRLDPYKPLAVKGKPLVIQAVAMEWKWLFIYPKQGIATVNFVQMPVNRPVRFFITADAPMNSFQIPRLAGQIYAMTGMQTKLNLMATSIGTYNGMSTNFSGEGFAGMHFKARVSSAADFNRWVRQQQNSRKKLTLATYVQLSQPGQEKTPIYYSSVPDKLFHRIIMQYMMPNKQLGKGSRAHR